MRVRGGSGSLTSVVHYVDHEPGGWFLLEEQGVLYLDARYSHSALIDDSALIRLDVAEVEAYRSGGHAYLTDLAARIHASAPYRAESRYFPRDLYRGPQGAHYREAVAGAVAGRTWADEQRRTT